MSRPVQSYKAISIASVVLFGSLFAFAQSDGAHTETGDQQAEARPVHLAGDGNNQHQG